MKKWKIARARTKSSTRKWSNCLTFWFSSIKRKTISSSTTIPTKPIEFTSSDTLITVVSINPDSIKGPPPSIANESNIVLKWNNSNNDYYLIVVENIETSLNPINTKQNKMGKPNFRNQPNQNNEYRVNSRNFEYLGKHNVILFKLNSDYAALYNETGTNSQNLSTAISNINNGLGIFTGINTDTLNINVKK